MTPERARALNKGKMTVNQEQTITRLARDNIAVLPSAVSRGGKHNVRHCPLK